jgi:hypothetical protein
VLATLSSLMLSNFWTRAGMALEAGGQTLLTTVNNGCLARINLSGGPATILGCEYETSYHAFTLEPGGATLLLGEVSSFTRIFLSPNRSTVASGIGRPNEVVVESGGASALVTDSGGFTGPPRILRVNLTTGAPTTLATIPQFFGVDGLALNALGSQVHAIGDNQHLIRIELGNGTSSTLTSLISGISPGRAALAGEAAGSSLLILGAMDLQRVSLTPPHPISVVAPGVRAYSLAFESGGLTAIAATDGPPCLVRLDLTSWMTEEISTEARPLKKSTCEDVALEPGGTSALVTQSARVLRVNLLTGAVSVIALGGFTGGRLALTIHPSDGYALILDQGFSGPDSVLYRLIPP